VAYLTTDREGDADSLNSYGWREKESAFCELMEKPKGNVSLGRPWHRWDDNIHKWILMWGSMVCIRLAENRGQVGAVAKTVTKHSASIKCGKLVD
jgi:hypothetical protein